MLADAFLILVSLPLGTVALTQILVPLIQNKPLFGSFRASYRKEKWLKQQLEPESGAFWPCERPSQPVLTLVPRASATSGIT